MTTLTLPLHLGSLHTYETVLLALLAFGPFVVLAVVVLVIRRRDLDEPAEGGDATGSSGSGTAAREE